MIIIHAPREVPRHALDKVPQPRVPGARVRGQRHRRQRVRPGKGHGEHLADVRDLVALDLGQSGVAGQLEEPSDLLVDELGEGAAAGPDWAGGGPFGRGRRVLVEVGGLGLRFGRVLVRVDLWLEVFVLVEGPGEVGAAEMNFECWEERVCLLLL